MSSEGCQNGNSLNCNSFYFKYILLAKERQCLPFITQNPNKRKKIMKKVSLTRFVEKLRAQMPDAVSINGSEVRLHDITVAKVMGDEVEINIKDLITSNPIIASVVCCATL